MSDTQLPQRALRMRPSFYGSCVIMRGPLRESRVRWEVMGFYKS